MFKKSQVFFLRKLAFYFPPEWFSIKLRNHLHRRPNRLPSSLIRYIQYAMSLFISWSRLRMHGAGFTSRGCFFDRISSRIISLCFGRVVFFHTLLEELLNREICTPPTEAKALIKAWGREYNPIRQPSALACRPPATEAIQIKRPAHEDVQCSGAGQGRF